MKQAIWIAAAFGFMMPILWGFASFALFTLPQGPAADLYWHLNHFFCPLFFMPTLFELPFTAGLYALLAFLLLVIPGSLQQRKAK
jgi:hypothetical protein